MICVLSGGVGAAKFLRGLLRVIPPTDVTAVVNTADDMTLHGLHISPDLDTVTYTLADEVNPETGWGLRGETLQAMESLRRYGGQDWFTLGDRDLGTHLYRTQRLSEGASLAEVTGEIARAWGLELTIVPVTDDPLATMITLAGDDASAEISFQDYFVGRQHGVPISAVRFAGADEASPAPGVIEAITDAEVVVIAPSNPIVSIGPLLAIPGVADTLRGARDRTVAISPIVAGAALKGPADRMLVELGHEATVVGVAKIYADYASTLVIDDADAASHESVEACGLRCVETDTIMASPDIAAALARTVLAQVPKGNA